MDTQSPADSSRTSFKHLDLVLRLALCFFTVLLYDMVYLVIFYRRTITDIGLGTGSGAGRKFSLGLLFGAGSAALMLLAPLLAGTGHLVSRTQSQFSWGGLVFYLAILIF